MQKTQNVIRPTRSTTQTYDLKKKKRSNKIIIYYKQSKSRLRYLSWNSGVLRFVRL